MRDFRYLDVWHKAHAFTLHEFQATDRFPRAETLGLAGTIRRSATTLTMKIAEDCGRDNEVDYVRCLQHSRAVGVEVEYQLLHTRDLQFLDTSSYDALQGQLIEVRRMLSGLIKSVHTGPV